MKSQLFLKRLVPIICAVLLLLLAGCSKFSAEWQQMSHAEQIIEQRPDSALAILKTINPDALHSDETKARYALLMSMALDKNCIDIASDSIISPATSYYLFHGTDTDRLRMNYYYGRICQNMGLHTQAMAVFRRAQIYIKGCTDTLAIARLHVALGSEHYRLNNITEYVTANQLAAKNYQLTGHPDRAMRCLTRAMNGALVNSDSIQYGMLYAKSKDIVAKHPELEAPFYAYAQTYNLLFGDNEAKSSALQTLSNAADVPPNVLLSMAGHMSAAGKQDAAMAILNRTPQPDDPIYNMYRNATLSALLEQQGNHAAALAAHKQYISHLLEINAFILSQSNFAGSNFENMAFNYTLLVEHRKKLILTGVCCILALALLAVFLYYRYRLSQAKRRLAERDKEQLALERDNLKELLQSQTNMAKPIEAAIKERIELLNGLLAKEISENDAYAKPYSEWIDRVVKDKDKFMNSNRLAFTASHPRFIEYLQEHGLNESEINYLCLYAIGLRGKEVGEYIQLRRHYNISSEIRRKLGIDEHETNIGIYVRKLMKNL
ncbi:MAG: hypothetical protein ACI4AH_04455 [Muribaculaceae bacterium]